MHQHGIVCRCSLRQHDVRYPEHNDCDSGARRVKRATHMPRRTSSEVWSMTWRLELWPPATSLKCVYISRSNARGASSPVGSSVSSPWGSFRRQRGCSGPKPKRYVKPTNTPQRRRNFVLRGHWALASAIVKLCSCMMRHRSNHAEDS